MSNDPRSQLADGSYRATVMAVREGWLLDEQGDRYWGIESIDYALPGCGDWRWQLRDDSLFSWGARAPQAFLVNAVREEWFEWVKGGLSRQEATE